MSVEIMARVWKHSRHANGTLLVLLAIADFANDDGYAYPAVGTIAKKARVSERTVYKILKELEQAGEIEIFSQQGPYGTNLYRVVVSGDPPAIISGCRNLTLLKGSDKPSCTSINSLSSSSSIDRYYKVLSSTVPGSDDDMPDSMN